MSVQVDYAIFEKFRKHSESKHYLMENPRFKCEECNEILIQPYQTECGTRYCYSCIKRWNDLRKCPGCDETISSMEKNIIPDKAIEKEIFKLTIKCINEECEERFLFKDLKDHLEICNFNEEICCHCNESYRNKKEHLDYKCRKIMTMCTDCGEQFTREQMETIHRNANTETVNGLCPNWSRLCPYNCCDKKFDSVKLHLQQCSKRPEKCLFVNIGCQKIVTEESLDDHLKTDEAYHLQLLTNCLLKIRSEQTNIQSQLLATEKLYTSNVDDIKKSTLASSQRISQHSNNVLEQGKIVEDLKQDVEIICNSPRSKPVSNNSPVQLISISNNSVELLWPVKNIIQKINNAKNDIETQIMSEPFYLNIPGYRMRLKLYPNGDGIGLNQFLSIYLVIVKGKYDDVIHWPFSKKVTLSLEKYNRTFLSTLISMKPNINPDCYAKPSNESNVGFGHPKFLKISQIMGCGEYTTDGSIFVKMNVEL